MRQADIQRLRKILATQVTEVHALKGNTKRLISYWWERASPETEEGTKAFHSLNHWKKESRSLTRELARLSALIKLLKKEERKEIDRRMKEYDLY